MDLVLPDIGTLQYGKVIFDALKHTRLHSEPEMDASGRTVKWVKHTLTVEGVVCILAEEVPVQSGQTVNTAQQWLTLRQQLETAGQPLTYTGRLGRLLVNAMGSPIRDVNWGPKGRVLELHPLGGGLAADIRWEVETCVVDFVTSNFPTPLAEFTYESDISYDEDCYATVTLSGTMEIPLTWNNPQNLTDRRLADHVDNYRQRFLNNPPTIPDFQVKRRSFNISKDKRHMDWSFTYEEMAPMGTPVYCTKAKGQLSIRPRTGGPGGLSVWNCHLSASYTVRKDQPRRYAYLSFLLLLLDRMRQTQYAILPPLNTNEAAPQQQAPSVLPSGQVQGSPAGTASAIYHLLFAQRNNPPPASNQPGAPNNAIDKRRAVLMHFSIQEGLFEDSRSMSFEASWFMAATLASMLAAAGVWRQVTHLPRQVTDVFAETDKTLWRTSMADIQGHKGHYFLQETKDNDLVIDLAIPALPTPPLPAPAQR